MSVVTLDLGRCEEKGLDKACWRKGLVEERLLRKWDVRRELLNTHTAVHPDIDQWILVCQYETKSKKNREWIRFTSPRLNLRGDGLESWRTRLARGGLVEERLLRKQDLRRELLKTQAYVEPDICQ